jgi:hypothetical protein
MIQDPLVVCFDVDFWSTRQLLAAAEVDARNERGLDLGQAVSSAR